MTDYVKGLEEQIEQMQKKLALCEDFTPYWKHFPFGPCQPIVCVYESVILKYAKIDLERVGNSNDCQVFIKYATLNIRQEKTCSSPPIPYVNKEEIKKFVNEAMENVESNIAGGYVARRPLDIRT